MNYKFVYMLTYNHLLNVYKYNIVTILKKTYFQ